MSVSLLIDVPGLQTTLQDIGRTGYQRFGVPVSGALDREALALANALVGNAPDTVAIEIRAMGPEFTVEGGSARIALVGAEAEIAITRKGETTRHGAGRSLTLGAGDRVRIGALRHSAGACLAVAGGIAVAPVLGSRATFLRGGFGGYRGRALAAGDRLELAAEGAPEGPERALARPLDLTPPERIRVVLGPQEDHFTAAARETFLCAEWSVTKDADRMGLRLDGPELAHAHGHDITSDGIVTGAIQVPGTRRPILLLADRQTSGGYPKIATAISADLPALGRLGPGQTIRFEAVSAEAGARAARARAEEVAAMIAAIGPDAQAGAIDIDALYEENLISARVDCTPDP